MKSKKLLTITLTSLLIGSCLVLPALADSADAPSGGNVATYEISANVKRIDEYAFANSTSLVSVKIPDSVTAIGDYLDYHIKCNTAPKKERHCVRFVLE